MKSQESCATCRFRTGSRCNKNHEYIEHDGWCSAYKKLVWKEVVKDVLDNSSQVSL